jgi:glyoxylase-like metal-dependent hydrolase (beta-lactamase superfamily II)
MKTAFVFALIFALAALLAPASRAQAQADPGFAKFSYGGLAITALSDATGTMGPDLLFDRSQEDLKADLAANGLTGAFPSWVNAFAVQKGDDLFLIDTGTGNPQGALAQLKAAGLDPEKVKYVLLTHFHSDHVGGLLNPDGSAAFPNAKIYAAVEEDNYFLPKTGQPPSGGAGLPKLFAPYKESDSYVLFTPGAELVPGVGTVDLTGHTPGHTGFLFESSAGSVLFFGDIVHVYLVQLPHPEVTISYDVNRPVAKATRLELLPLIAANGWVTAGAHLPFPGIGNISPDGAGYKWGPLAEAKE